MICDSLATRTAPSSKSNPVGDTLKYRANKFLRSRVPARSSHSPKRSAYGGKTKCSPRHGFWRRVNRGIATRHIGGFTVSPSIEIIRGTKTAAPSKRHVNPRNYPRSFKFCFPLSISFSFSFPLFPEEKAERTSFLESPELSSLRLCFAKERYLCLENETFKSFSDM